MWNILLDIFTLDTVWIRVDYISPLYTSKLIQISSPLIIFKQSSLHKNVSYSRSYVSHLFCQELIKIDLILRKLNVHCSIRSKQLFIIQFFKSNNFITWITISNIDIEEKSFKCATSKLNRFAQLQTRTVRGCSNNESLEGESHNHNNKLSICDIS